MLVASVTDVAKFKAMSDSSCPPALVSDVSSGDNRTKNPQDGGGEPNRLNPGPTYPEDSDSSEDMKQLTESFQWLTSIMQAEQQHASSAKANKAKFKALALVKAAEKTKFKAAPVPAKAAPAKAAPPAPPAKDAFIANLKKKRAAEQHSGPKPPPPKRASLQSVGSSSRPPTSSSTSPPPRMSDNQNWFGEALAAAFKSTAKADMSPPAKAKTNLDQQIGNSSFSLQ